VPRCVPLSRRPKPSRPVRKRPDIPGGRGAWTSLDELAAHGAGWQAHVEDLAAHLAGRERADWRTQWSELTPHYREQAEDFGEHRVGRQREHLVRLANGAILSQNERVLATHYATIDSPTLAWGWTRPEVGPLWLPDLPRVAGSSDVSRRLRNVTVLLGLSPEPTPYLALGLGKCLDNVLLGLSSLSDAKHVANLLPRST
jgi:hypothetical protein